MTAFDKTTRRKIFYSMVLLFGIAAPLALLYSRGYVFDLKQRNLVATGGIFVKTVQAGARVYVERDFFKETSFISHGALVTDLLPRRYAVRVEKDGHRPWSKVVRVSNEEVVEFRDVLLPPATVTPAVIFNAQRRTPSLLTALPGRKDIALAVGDPTRPATLYVVNPQTRRAPINVAAVQHWAWDEHSRTFTIGRVVDGALRWWRLAGDEEGGREEPVVLRGLPAAFSAQGVRPHPTSAEEFYFFAGGVLFLQGRASVPVPIAEQIHSYAITAERIYFLSRNGFFAESDLAGGETKILGRKGLLLEEDRPAPILPSPGGDVAVLDAAGGLFLYQPRRDQELELVAANVGGVDFSANGERMLFWDDHRLWIYWLRDNAQQPFDLAGSKKQIFFSEAKIRQAFLNAAGSHVFFSTQRGIRMTEVDDRAGVNTYDLTDSSPDSFAFDREGLVLYWTEGSRLYRAALNP